MHSFVIDQALQLLLYFVRCTTVPMNGRTAGVIIKGIVGKNASKSTRIDLDAGKTCIDSYWSSEHQNGNRRCQAARMYPNVIEAVLSMRISIIIEVTINCRLNSFIGLILFSWLNKSLGWPWSMTRNAKRMKLQVENTNSNGTDSWIDWSCTGIGLGQQSSPSQRIHGPSVII